MNCFILKVVTILLSVASGMSQHMGRRKYQVLTLDDTRIPCSKNMACRLAICLWEPQPTISEDLCTMLDNTCTCPSGQICALSNNYTPRKQLVTYEYRCKSSAELLSWHH